MTPALVILLSSLAASAPGDGGVTAAQLDRAAACMRRSQLECVIAEASAAAQTAGAEADKREALILLGTALALSDREADAGGRFDQLLVVAPRWRPAPDSDPRVITAAEAALARRIASKLPTEIGIGPPPTPTPGPSVELLPPPPIYAPLAIRAIDAEAAARRPWRLSAGGGAAFLGPESSEVLDAGVAASIDGLYYLNDYFALWTQLAITLHSFTDGLSLEPGSGRGLTTVAWGLGGMLTTTIGAGFELNVGAVAGIGAFGLADVGEIIGFAVTGNLGIRIPIRDPLAFRLDAVPQLTIPGGSEAGPAGHVTALGRFEVRF